ncbi:MAG: putative quinol monooxygenase [Paraburkholderia sp.]|uniref:putative quinol monooxygenase n=1 Tax=Paraburkholderia sp. TaxID=1926495 RepID=UPI003C4408D9
MTSNIESPAPIVVFASFVPKNGKEQEVQRALRAVLPPTRCEPGCLQFDLLVSVEPHTTFRLYEVFATKQAIDEHRLTDHYRIYRATIDPLLQGAPSVVVMSPLDVASLTYP